MLHKIYTKHPFILQTLNRRLHNRSFFNRALPSVESAYFLIKPFVRNIHKYQDSSITGILYDEPLLNMPSETPYIHRNIGNQLFTFFIRSVFINRRNADSKELG